MDARSERLRRTAGIAADGAAILAAISLPWSTSAMSILVVVWFVALIPTLTWSQVKEECTSWHGATPLLLFGLALLSLAWTEASLHEGLNALRPVIKLLTIPFLIMHFRRSDKGVLALAGFLLSCTLLLAASAISQVLPEVATTLGFKYPGMPVKDAIAQSAEFATCGFALLFWAGSTWSQRRYRLAIFLAVWAALFFANNLYVATSRTELIVEVVLFAILFGKLLGWRGIPIGLALACVIFAVAWPTSPYLRFRIHHVSWELQEYYRHNAATSAGDRLEWWRKSVEFVRAAPVLGHGVGSIRPLFAAGAVGETGVSALVTRNPHNQFFAIAIELGLVGVVLLLAMWFAHFRLFLTATGLPWFGLMVVVQNFVASFFNSHLFDFTQGWMYAFGVGILGGMTLRRPAAGEQIAAAGFVTIPGPFAAMLERLGGGFTKASPSPSPRRVSGDRELIGFYGRRATIVVHDLTMTAIAIFAALYIRFEDASFLAYRLHWLIYGLPVLLAVAACVYGYFRLYTSKWRFASLPDLWNIVKAVTILSLALLILDYVLVSPKLYGDLFFGKITIAVYWVLQIFLLGGPRIAYRLFRFYRTQKTADPDAIPILVLGRTADAEILIRAVESGAVKKVRPVGILSPSRADQRQILRGIKVLGRLDDLETVARQFEARGSSIKEVVFTSSALLPENHPETLLSAARRLGLTVRRLPSLDAHEEVRLAPVNVEDLLLRPSISIDYERLRRFVKGTAVIVTGGGGSIGSELCERVLSFDAGRLLVVDCSEHALYSITERLKILAPHANVEGRIADVRDRERIFRLFADFRPDLVFHSAALKHVPLLELDCEEGIRTNVFGSVNVADAAVAAGASGLVMISTDKAIEPVSVLGASKRLAEIYCQALDATLAAKAKAGEARTRLISVRFGNVLASNGSVVPKFKAQIEAGGPVTVTHPDMVRYFMTIKEACDLVITAGSHALGPNRSDAAVYVLEMGQPVKILDLAERMIKLSGLEPGRDIEIVFTGVRPGERLHEILFARREAAVESGLPGVVAAKPVHPSLDEVHGYLDLLRKKIAATDRDALLDALHRAVPDFMRVNGGTPTTGRNWQAQVGGRDPVTEESNVPR